MKLNTKTSLKTFGLFAALLLSGYAATAQCYISTTGPLCVGEPIGFNCNTTGGSNFMWDFNSQGTSTIGCNPAFIFSTPGNKVISFTMKLANGQTCSSSLTILVKAKPVIRVTRISNFRQCFKNNSFCFRDSSTAATGDSICKTTIQIDDGTPYVFYGKGPRTFCHSFQDPAGGTYGMTVKVETCSGCVTITRVNGIAKVDPSLQLSFSSLQPKRCDSVLLCVTNNSKVSLDSIQSFSWDWGDSTVTNGNKNTPSLWKTQVCHWFKTQGPRNGEFDTKLTVTNNFGCTEEFTFNFSAMNVLNQPVILADFDSVCSSNAEISFRLKDGPIVGAANPLFTFEQPFIPANISRNWTGKHKFMGPGVYKINFSYTHTIPGCGRTIYDTILVIGPQSIIEGPASAGMNFIADSLRYQCVIQDTVRFGNFSKFYHNDPNMTDDDSTYTDLTGFNKPLGHKFSGTGNQVSLKANPQNRGNSHVNRMWDFDDDYCEKCTTDINKGINMNKNCRYSKDSLPQHWYTPWDEIYLKKFSSKPEYVSRYDVDSGLFYQRNLWSDDTVAIIRDTILYYGDNPTAIKAKDSVVYNTITKKVKGPKEIRGISRTDFKYVTTFRLEAGDTVYTDKNDGLPPNRWIGPRYLTLLPGYSLDIKNKTDKALYHIWIEFYQDTISRHLLESSHKVWKLERVKGFKVGDSVNAAAHRQKFYSGSKVRCFNVKLTHKDVVHPMACASEVTATLSLQPPSAKKLRKSGVQCLGGDQGTYGITFILDETKPGCSRTWAEINFDTAKDKNAWVKAIGKNLGPGAISAGGLPPVNPPYGVPLSGYNGLAPNRFSTQYTSKMIKDTFNGYVNVGLIIGNGIWSNGSYPQMCQDTVYYEKFAKFPMLDNRFRIVKPKEGNKFNNDYTHICRKDTLSLSTMGWNRSNMLDIKTASWSLTSANVGKYYDKYHVLSVDETYNRFVSVHPDTTYLVDKLTVLKRSSFGGKIDTMEKQEIRIAKITQWHTEADISNVYEQVKMILDAAKVDISELSPSQLAKLVWNGKGIIGKPYTNSRGIIDTTGFGKLIIFTTIADQKQTLHYRDTSLLPINKTKGADGKTYNAYSLVPQYTGVYTANFELNKNTPGTCPKVKGAGKKVIVGFYGLSDFTDTIICHGQQVNTHLEFRYFEVYPEITFRLLDPVDYWANRIQEAGNVNREGYTRTDLSKADDDKTKPLTIFGAFPYMISGLANKPNRILQLGGLTGGIYYDKDTGDMYIIRTAASDSFGCPDTLTQEIFTTAARAKFRLKQTPVQCNTVVEFFDSSYVIDAHKVKYGIASDRIIKWTLSWHDMSIPVTQTFFDFMPNGIKYEFKNPGRYIITLKVESELGCVKSDTVLIHIPGPIALFDTLIKRKYCIGEKVNFKNLSRYQRKDSSEWVWSFGDGIYDKQFDTITSSNDTMSHRYQQAGTYNVFLNEFYKKNIGTSCKVTFPDTSNGWDPLFTLEVIDCDTTGINHHVFVKDVKMYPNPAHNRLTITSKEKIEIIITDAMGKTIRTFMNEGEQTIDLKNLSPGLYIVTTGNRQMIGKLIVE